MFLQWPRCCIGCWLTPDIFCTCLNNDHTSKGGRTSVTLPICRPMWDNKNQPSAEMCTAGRAHVHIAIGLYPKGWSQFTHHLVLINFFNNQMVLILSSSFSRLTYCHFSIVSSKKGNLSIYNQQNGVTLTSQNRLIWVQPFRLGHLVDVYQTPGCQAWRYRKDSARNGLWLDLSKDPDHVRLSWKYWSLARQGGNAHRLDTTEW